ncbi:MAG: septum site-determining protein MinC [Hydrogenobacter sp.]|uniref:septum site-determining protein MinC n=1 Tax=Hydrogenobacter thermophilus TaxID=940 RepID=UPI0030FAEB74
MIEIRGLTLPVVVIKVKEKLSPQEVIGYINERLSSKLFNGSYFLLDGGGFLNEEDLSQIENFLSSKNIRSVKKLNLDTGEREKGRLLVVQRHLRSGQKVEHNGDILILGNVNKDAQVIASGNIIVMGKLRGIAVAGALGDESAVVVALQMEPQQIRIGRKVAISSDEDRRSPGYPEVAKIENDTIVLEKVKG